MGETAGHVTDEAVGIVTLVAIITIGLSTYMIIYAQPLYERLARYLHVFERKVPHREDADRALVQQAEADTIILIGLGNYGANIGAHLLAHGRPVLGIDFDPSAVARWNARGARAVFGDAGDPDFAHALSLSSAQWVISSLRDPQVDAAIVHTLRQAGYHGLIALAAENRDDVPERLRKEADLLFVPFEDAAEQAVEMVTTLEDELARKAMEKHIDTLSGHYVICGYGRMGQQIVKDFKRQGVVFVVVEDNPEQLPRLKAGQVPHVVGQASQDEVLTRAGILRARGLIAVASTDEENVFIVLSARGMNPALHIVARSIREENEDKLRRAGADHVMSPYILGGHRMAAVVTRPNVMDFLDLVLHSDAVATEIEHVVVPPAARCVHCSLRELSLWQACGVTVLAVQRAGGSLTANPCPSFTLEAGDELILMGTPAQIDAVRAHLATAGADEESAVQPV